MLHRLTVSALLLAGSTALCGFTSDASADNRCSTLYVWGHQSYFGDRFVYSHRHAYPRHSYRSSRHYIYYRRVPHFYSSSYSNVHTSNYYASPEYRAYFNKGPYFEPSEYSDEQRYQSPNTRPYTPNCEPNSADVYSDEQVYDAPNIERQPIAQPTLDEQRARQRHLLSATEGSTLIERGWSLLETGDAATAMPVFAKAAMLRSDDVQPRIGYALAATLEGHEMIAAWAFRTGVLTDAAALSEVTLDNSVAEALDSELTRLQEAKFSDDDGKRDAVVIVSVLAILLDREMVLDNALEQLAALDEPTTMQALIKASKARSNADAEDAPAETVATAN